MWDHNGFVAINAISVFQGVQRGCNGVDADLHVSAVPSGSCLYHGGVIAIMWTGTGYLIGLRAYVRETAGGDKGLGARAVILKVVCTFLDSGRGRWVAMVEMDWDGGGYGFAGRIADTVGEGVPGPGAEGLISLSEAFFGYAAGTSLF